MKQIFTSMFFTLLLCAGSNAFGQYTFIGSGNWSSASNWDSMGIPPNPTAAVNININGTGPAILDMDQTILYSSPFGSGITIQATSGLTINLGRKFIINSAVYFTNYGTLINNGSIDVAFSDFFNYNSLTNNGTIQLLSHGNFGNANGSVASMINNGTISFDTLSSFYNNSASTFTNNGTVNNSSISGFATPGTFDNYGTVNNGGVFYNGEPGVSTITAILNNYSIVNNNANGFFQSLGTLNNYSTLKNNTEGLLYIQNASPGSVLNNKSGGTITNDGTWSNEATTNIINNGILSNNSNMTNSGTLINSVQLINNAGANFDNIQTIENNGTITNNGTLSNNGTYKGTGIFTGTLFTNSGIVAPGVSQGCLSFSNDFTNNSRLEMEINGTTGCTKFDRLNVNGTATAGGQLALNFGITPTVGQTFKIINAGSFAGSFSSIISTPTHTVSYSNGVITVNAVFKPAITITDQSMKEGNSGTQNMIFTVSLNGVSADTVRIKYKTIDMTATAPSDYLSATGNVIFNPGETVKTISITINGDNTIETNEKFKVKLSAPQNATIAKSTGKGTIRNDDIAAVSFQSNNIAIKSDELAKIKIYPNPSSGAFTVSLASYADAGYTLKIVDVKGRTIEVKKITSKDFSFGSNLQPGTYFIEITKANVLVAREKVIRLN